MIKHFVFIDITYIFETNLKRGGNLPSNNCPPRNLPPPLFCEVPLECPDEAQRAQNEKQRLLRPCTFRARSSKPFSTPNPNRRRAERSQRARAGRREGGRKGSTLLRPTKGRLRRSCAEHAERRCISKTRTAQRSARRAEIWFSRCQKRVPQTVSEPETCRFERRSSGELERRPR